MKGGRSSSAIWLLLTAALAFAAPSQPHEWHEAVVQSIDYGALGGTTLFLVSEEKVYRLMQYVHVRKRDLLPVSGMVTLAKRMERETAQVHPGSTVKFAVKSRQAWVIDETGTERTFIVKRVSAVGKEP